MELTETERLMLVGKKEEIRKLTEDILELTYDLKKNGVELKKKVTGILSLISTIASYSNPKNINIHPLIGAAQFVFHMLEAEVIMPRTTNTLIGIFCNTVNSITFDFTRKDFKIIMPKIDISLFRAK